MKFLKSEKDFHVLLQISSLWSLNSFFAKIDSFRTVENSVISLSIQVKSIQIVFQLSSHFFCTIFAPSNLNSAKFYRLLVYGLLPTVNDK